MAYRIKLKKVGREKFSKTFKSPAENEIDAGYEALHEVEKHLISSNVQLIPIGKDEDGKYMVSAGFQKVGEVEIKKVK